ncbi:MAG: hypothetical protein ACREQL_01085 [Candidatus Binatia bacterium]
MRAIVTSTLIVLAVIGPAHAADVQVGINIGIPAPPALVVPALPRLVIVPTTPAVQYAPDLSVNFFFYGGSYYTFSDGAWFVASAYNGPWAYVERVRVPRPVLIVPYRYYRMPPGHSKKLYGGHPHGMPPGQAKKIYGSRPYGGPPRFAEESHDRDHGHGHHHGDD